MFPHWIAVVPPHHQVLLNHWGRRDPLLPEFWLDRSEALLQAAGEFRGASWAVDGPLLHDLADSRDELGRIAGLSAAEATRREGPHRPRYSGDRRSSTPVANRVIVPSGGPGPIGPSPIGVRVE